MDSIYNQNRVNEYFEIVQLKNVINSLCVYEPLAKGRDKQQIQKVQRFFLRILAERRAVITNRFFKADPLRMKILERLEKLPAYEQDCEMSCIICETKFNCNRKTNLFGYNCNHCHSENSVFPAWIIATEVEAVIPPTVGAR